MCDISGETCDVWVEERRKARKTYRCDECFAQIPKGFDYIHISGLLDGDWERWHVHFECMTLWNVLIEDICGGKGQIMIGGLEDELQEHDIEYLTLVNEDGEDNTENHILPLYQAIRDSYKQMEVPT